MSQPGAFLHQEFHNIKLAFCNSLEQRCLSVDILLIEIEMIKCLKEPQHLHVFHFDSDMSSCELLVDSFTSSHSPWVQLCYLTSFIEIPGPNRLQKLC